MDESRIWGTVGVLLAVAGLLIVAADSEFAEAVQHGGFGEPLVLYVVAVAIAAAITALVILPNVLRGNRP